MVRIDIGESFPITVALWDEATGQNASGRIVYYDVRDDNDNPLSPTLNGILVESTTTSGIYQTTLSIDVAGEYICYVYSDEFYSSSEEIIVNSENIYDVVKQTHNYNISVEDVLRTTDPGDETASQLTRKVPYLKTDYIVTSIRADGAVDWSNPVASGIVYAWYTSIIDTQPYKMEGEN